MTLTRDKVPREEQDTLAIYNLLSKKEKKTLTDLVKITNDDSSTVCMKLNNEIRGLEQKGLIEINPNYTGIYYSFYVLKDAPNLKKKLSTLQRWRFFSYL